MLSMITGINYNSTYSKVTLIRLNTNDDITKCQQTNNEVLTSKSWDICITRKEVFEVMQHGITCHTAEHCKW